MEFKREKRDSIERPGQTEVLYKLEKPEDSNFFIKATAMGIYFSGTSPLIASNGDMDELAQVVGKASNDYILLRRALTQRLAN